MATTTERRIHKRFDVPCRVRIERDEGPPLRARTANVSDGGAFFCADTAARVGDHLQLLLSVPRETANTFFLEQFAARAEVVRREAPAEGAEEPGLAVRFEEPLGLDLP
jgi:c-di-GMP-binding flagellar brake protein YcgR